MARNFQSLLSPGYYYLYHYDYFHYYLEGKLSRRNLPGDDTKRIHVSGKGVTLPREMVGSAEQTHSVTRDNHNKRSKETLTCCTIQTAHLEVP